jgi:Lrp/AsnC family leucine-responsive transcriptional regulator
MFDDVDRQILAILQQDARTANAEIARRVGLAPSAIFERMRKLQENGIVESFSAHVNPRAVGLGLLAFVFVRTDESGDTLETARRLGEVPGVLEVHNVAGEDCYIVKVRAADTEGLGRLLRERIRKVESVRATRTTIVLETIKSTTDLPLDGDGGVDGRKRRD